MNRDGAILVFIEGALPYFHFFEVYFKRRKY